MLWTSLCVHKANRARFYARSRDGRDSVVTWEIVYCPGFAFAFEKRSYTAQKYTTSKILRTI